MPHYRDLFDQVSDFWHGEMKRTPIRAAALQRDTEMFFPHKDGFRDQLLYHRLLIPFLTDKTFSSSPSKNANNLFKFSQFLTQRYCVALEE